MKKTAKSKDGQKTKDHLIKELAKARKRIATLEKLKPERKRADEQILKQSAVLEAINRVLRETLTCETDEEAARTCLAVAEELTGSKFGFIGEVNKAGLFDTLALSDPGWDKCKMPKTYAVKMIMNMEVRGIWGKVIKEGNALFINDPSSDPDRVGTPEGHPQITCFLGVPLKQEGQTIGMISLANKESGYNFFDQEAVEALSVAFVEALNRKRVDKALRESEERYRNLIETSPDAIALLDLSMKIIMINRAGVQLFGYESEEELIGKCNADFIAPEEYSVAEENAKKLLETGAPIVIEHTMVRKDGTRISVETRVSMIVDEEEKPVAFLSMARDITELKKNEEMFREAEERLRSIVETAKEGIVNIDSEGNIISWNKAAEEMFGYTFDEIMGKPVTILMPPRFFENYESKMDEVVSAEHSAILERKSEVVGLRKDGTEFPVEHSIACWETKKGIFYTTIIRDVTERKKAESEIIETRDFLENVFSTTTDGIMISDPKGYVVRVNKAIEEMLGFTQKELVGKHTGELGPLDEHHVEIGTTLMTHLREHGFVKNFEATWLRKDGGLCPIELNIAKLGDSEGNSPGAVSVVRDITERKQAEEAIRESEERFRSLTECATDAIITIDIEGNIVQWNKAAEKKFGYEEDEIIGKPLTTIMPERLRDNYTNQFVKSTEGGISLSTEYPGRRKDGSEFPSEVSYSTWAAGGGTFFTAICRDITERKKAEEEIRTTRDYLENIIETAGDGIVMGDQYGYIVRVNKAIERMLGFTQEELIGKHTAELSPQDEHLVKLGQEIMTVFEEKEAVNNFGIPLLRKDGSLCPTEINMSTLKDNEGQMIGSVAFIRDITERKEAEEEKEKLEAQLRQSQKMEAVGVLAGGIAHDFNNILTAIIGYASLLQMKIKEDEHLKPHAEQILAASQRAANLTQSLLAFSRKQIINPRPVNVSEIITKMENLLGRIIGEDIDLLTTLAAGDTTVTADPGQIEQVLMNLVTNARDAMPQGGHLIIGTERTEIDHTYIRAHGYGKPGKYVLISVSDTGAGMDAKTCEQIFEPFFTTKEVGKGTGLGLAIVYGIIKQHNGFINCYSEPGKGTTFKVYLPVNREAGETHEAQQPAPELAGGSETILVAEDDADVRKLSRETLEHFGYTVLEAADGEDAVRVFMENKEKIHLLLLDVIMPNKNGKEAYNEIKKMSPDIKAIFISGYTANIIHKRGMLEQDLDFIMKPVSPTALVKKVRKVIDK